MTRQQGQIRILPGTKIKIKAFPQWTRGNISLGHNPSTAGYPVGDAGNLLQHFKTHETFFKKYKTLAEADNPIKLMKNTNGIDLEHSFMNYIHTIPERDIVLVV